MLRNRVKRLYSLEENRYNIEETTEMGLSKSFSSILFVFLFVGLSSSAFLSGNEGLSLCLHLFFWVH